MPDFDQVEAPVRRPSNHLVTAIIENTRDKGQFKSCLSPPSNATSPSMTIHQDAKESDQNSDINQVDEGPDDIITISAEECSSPISATASRPLMLPCSSNTPPNSAPLPAKFHQQQLPHNLLRIQLQKKSLIDCDTSSAASTTGVPSPIMQKTASNAGTAKEASSGCSKEFKLKLALPVKQRLMEDDSSSSDGTPRRLMKDSSSPLKGQHQVKVQQGRPKPGAPFLGRKMHKAPNAGKFILNLSGESESCSSAMSSMESVRSSNSAGSVHSLVSSSESGAGMSSGSQSNSNLSLPCQHFSYGKPTLELRTRRSNILSSAKVQVLSPISDKSQEQSCSEQGDSSFSKTPKISPTDHILASCCGVTTDDSENNNVGGNEQIPAPFDMPKLQRRLAVQQQQKLRQTQQVQPKQHQYYQTSSLLKKANNQAGNIQGSDSGISMSSQDVQDMVELLQLPFDMPKLRRKTQHILGRPQSMPTTSSSNTTSISNNAPNVVVARNTVENYQHHSMSSGVNHDHFQQNNFNNQLQHQQPPSSAASEWPGPKPSDVTSGSTMDNFHFTNSINNRTRNNSGSTEQLPHPAPPPGFADDNNQFYLTEETSDMNNPAGLSSSMGSGKSVDSVVDKDFRMSVLEALS